MEVALQNPSRYGGLRTTILRPWLGVVVADLAGHASSLSVRFLSSRAMRELNARYRGRDRATDVLSFPGEETPEGRHLGDIAIAVPVARRQAKDRGHSLERELKMLLLHGLLHCLGHDHETDSGQMRRRELRLRRRWIDGGS